MKILKIFNSMFKTDSVKPEKLTKHFTPITYDRNNVTEDEFRRYVKYLAENNINRTFMEPDRFVTPAERELQQQRAKELQEYKDFVHYLAENNINRTFLQ